MEAMRKDSRSQGSRESEGRHAGDPWIQVTTAAVAAAAVDAVGLGAERKSIALSRLSG